MPGVFRWTKFASVNIDDSFFDSLKLDYPEFHSWFARKAEQDADALVFTDSLGIGAFLYLKEENEQIVLRNGCLPAERRLKIGTLKLREDIRGQRLGEGAIGIALWHWQSLKVDEVYLTVFERHTLLIRLLEIFGFTCVGYNVRGECVYLKSRRKLLTSDPYKSFPFVQGNFGTAGLIPIYDMFHDRLFPYSELKGNRYEFEEEVALKGISKIYIGAPQNPVTFTTGDPVFIYRIDNTGGQKTFRSAITSFCTIVNVITINRQGVQLKTLEEYLDLASNKTVFSRDELVKVYTRRNLVMFEMVYNGFFGKGHNVNHRTLDDLGLFPCYPYDIKYGYNEFKQILELGDVDVSNVIIN